MTTTVTRRDYSLVGRDTKLAEERGLANAEWYSCKISRERLKELTQRRDGPAIRDTILWLGVLVLSGWLAYVTWGTWWAVPCFLIYGVCYGSLAGHRWHECGHRTAFKTTWMNDVIYELVSFMMFRESVVWRWKHTQHHTDTIIVGRDPEIAVPRPPDLPALALQLFALKSVPVEFKNMVRHARGKLGAEEATYIPTEEVPKVYRNARITLTIYAGVILWAIAARSILPLMNIGLPVFYGAWLGTLISLTEHAGLAEDVLDHRLNSRTVYLNPVLRFCAWEMNYHVEHHMFPMVPYHALGKLHQELKADMPPACRGLWGAYREIIPTLVRQLKDPTYHIKRALPTHVKPVPEPDAPEASDNATVHHDEWLEACDVEDVKPEDVIRFDHGAHTYCIYRTVDDRYFASEGLCTHAKAHLADGFVMDTIIECPKHNGRFDFTTGETKGAPAYINLKTYPVKIEDTKVFINVVESPE